MPPSRRLRRPRTSVRRLSSSFSARRSMLTTLGSSCPLPQRQLRRWKASTSHSTVLLVLCFPQRHRSPLQEAGKGTFLSPRAPPRGYNRTSLIVLIVLFSINPPPLHPRYHRPLPLILAMSPMSPPQPRHHRPHTGASLRPLALDGVSRIQRYSAERHPPDYGYRRAHEGARR
jgi:hypothetical protein